MTSTNGEKRPRPAPRYWLLSLTLAFVVGFLGANSFADAAGFPHPSGPNEGQDVFLRVVCGFVIGLATLAVVQILVRQVPLVVGVLARSPQRPGTAVSITLLVCGTLCVLGTLVLEGHMASTPPGVVQSIDIPGMNMRGAASISVSSSAPVMPHLLAAIVLLIGVALIALGVWGSLKAVPVSAVVGEVSGVPAPHMGTGIRDNPVTSVEP